MGDTAGLRQRRSLLVRRPGYRVRFQLRGCSAEVLAMVAGGRVEPSPKCSVHGLGGAEAGGPGDLGDGAVGRLEETAGRLEADCLDIASGGEADLKLEYSAETGVLRG